MMFVSRNLTGRPASVWLAAHLAKGVLGVFLASLPNHGVEVLRPIQRLNGAVCRLQGECGMKKMNLVSLNLEDNLARRLSAQDPSHLQGRP
jgi:hypothetical protein